MKSQLKISGITCVSLVILIGLLSFLLFLLDSASINQLENTCKEYGFISYESLNDLDLCMDKENYYYIVKFDCNTLKQQFFFENCKIKVINKLSMEIK